MFSLDFKVSLSSSLTSISSSQRPAKLSRAVRKKFQCANSSPDVPLATEKLINDTSVTGGAYDFERATLPLLTEKLLSSTKKVTLIRHGLSSWNEEGRVQVSAASSHIWISAAKAAPIEKLRDLETKINIFGSSNLSILTETGVKQAERCRRALANIHFDQCFSSPISRGKSTAEVIWEGREQPLVFLDSLKEAHLYFLEGMKNVDAKEKYPKEYTTWREDPANFNVNGIYPVRKLWGTAREAWNEILLSPGGNFLVITHKSILRALICTALGLGPERFRATDVNNGGICIFNFNKKGEAMLQALNMTAHMYGDHVYFY